VNVVSNLCGGGGGAVGAAVGLVFVRLERPHVEKSLAGGTLEARGVPLALHTGG